RLNDGRLGGRDDLDRDQLRGANIDPITQLLAPSEELADVNARRSRDLRGRHARLERCHHQALLLLTRPAAPSLDRRDHLHSRHRHRATPRIVPRTSDVRPQTARRPSPEGYLKSGGWEFASG